MAKYFVELTRLAKRDILAHKRSGNMASIKRIETILSELSEHPYSGTGQPEALKYQLHVLVETYQSKRQIDLSGT